MVALENRFIRTANGNIYSTTVCDYDFWKRYLQVFEKVIVLARVATSPEISLNKLQANGPGVEFFELPSFIGPWQYLKNRHRVESLVNAAVEQADAYILRVPGTVATLLWKALMKKSISYGVEVVGDPQASLGPGTVKSAIRPYIRFLMTRNQKLQCKEASAAAYVSESYLQKDYPSCGWSTHYSSIDLPADAFISKEELESKRIGGQLSNKPLRLCHIGSMSALYKSQDMLIRVVEICRKRGLDVCLHLLGDGAYRSKFEKEARDHGVKDYIFFDGRLPPGQPVLKWLDQGDIFVLPSLTEGLPRSMIEAMARGLPCIGTNVGGIPELLDEEYLVPPSNCHLLANKICNYAENPNKLAKMSLENWQKAREYEHENLNKRRIDFYNHLKLNTEKY
ncbi:glycosyltransferase [Anaerohalosphaera lusitana]|nr:glycosyltransferase [Anaerohalosphaera lusitana]